MASPEERDEDIRNDRETTDFDTPAAGRKGFLSRKQDGESGESASASRGYFVRRTLREREIEEERQHRQILQKPENDARYGNDEDYEYDYEDEGGTKAPRLVRLFAWAALLAIFFAGGYVGANYFFSKADRSGARIGGVVGSGREARESGVLPSASGLGDVGYKLYMPLAGGDFEARDIKISKGLPEEDIQRILTVYTDGLKELAYFEPGVQVLNIFRSGDWLYIDMSQDFQKSLKTMGKDKSALVLTGLVRTMQENFPPIKKIKFYVDGKESKDKNPVDIENAWELKG